MQEPATPPRLTLGLDIGSASIGWALIDPEGQRVAAAGVRIFDAGVDAAGFERGDPGASNNTARRQKRLQRRQFRRRAGRQRQLFRALQAAGLLPPTHAPGPHPGISRERHAVLAELDRALRAEFVPLMDASVAAPEHVLPYFLRARALDHALAPFALGRALYHLGQRRGFQSNRRDARDEAEEKKQANSDEKSDVKTGVKSLAEQIAAAGVRTLGEFYARQDTAGYRLRGRWTARSMFTDEFERIWKAQTPHNAALTPGLHDQIHQLLFYQRKVGSGRVGRCELERDCLRAPVAHLTAQRFRLLQKVNDLRVRDRYLMERELAPQERAALLAALQAEGDLTFAEIKRRGLVVLERGERFNLEGGGEKRLPGDRTTSKLRPLFGDRWDRWSEGERNHVVALWMNTDTDSELAQIGREELHLAADTAERWASTTPEEGHAKLSIKAMRKLLPEMEAGVAFKTAETKIYGDRFSGGAPLSHLLPVEKALPTLPNPAVKRTLTELRKLVNAIVREHGKPWEIRIELARDLKRNAAQRARLSDTMRKREAERRRLEKRLQIELGRSRVSARDLETALLFEQAKGVCPYCGECLALGDMFDSGRGQSDHILPRSRFPDDSFANRCIAHVHCNQEKANRTPFEAFGSDAERWPQILERVKKWEDPGKLLAFQAAASDLNLEDDNSFASRRLNETRYATTQAAKYLGLLYGGRDIANGDGGTRRAIFASSGMATATLRRAWCLESILRQPEASANGQRPGKPRHDHRHHAVDAMVVALTSNATIQRLSLANAAAAAAGSERTSSRCLPAPWPDFVERVRPAIEAIVVSHRPNHKLAGELHQETNYSKPHVFEDREYVHVRKPVHVLTAAQVKGIVDSAVARAVMDKIATIGDVKKLEHDLPHLVTKSGRAVKIARIRIRAERSASTRVLARQDRQRRILERASHHIELFAGRDRKNRDVWKGRVISRLKAQQLRAAHQQIVNQGFDEPGFEFLFSLMGGDTVEMQWDKDQREIAVVRTVSQSPATGIIELAFVRHTQAAKITDIKAQEKLSGRVEWLRITRLTELQERGCRKVTVDPIGRVREARD